MTAETDSSASTPVELARRLFDRLDARDLDGMGELQHPDIVEDLVVLDHPLRGRAEVRRFFAELLAAAPDFRLEIEHLYGDAEHATVQWRGAGTLSGAPFQGVAPNGRRITLRGVDVMVFREGKLARNTVYYDGAAFARGVGLLPSQGSAVERGLLAAFNAVTALRRAVGL